jgi:hypothetical protein
MVSSQLMVELLGAKAVQGEEPPMVLYFNPKCSRRSGWSILRRPGWSSCGAAHDIRSNVTTVFSAPPRVFVVLWPDTSRWTVWWEPVAWPLHGRRRARRHGRHSSPSPALKELEGAGHPRYGVLGRRWRRLPPALLEQEAAPRALASAQEDGGWVGGVAEAETSAGRMRSDGSRRGG